MEGRLGGFHFNDRKYADDDLTLGSIDPYAVFRIFSEIVGADSHGLATSSIAYMVDQSHNLKPKIQAMIQTAITAQELYAKACLVDRNKLRAAQDAMDLVAAEGILREAFFKDVEGLLADWRASRGVPADPMGAYRESGIEEKLAAERVGRLDHVAGSSYA
jgi:L-rhamnose isomerase/sugar isomerase